MTLGLRLSNAVVLLFNTCGDRFTDINPRYLCASGNNMQRTAQKSRSALAEPHKIVSFLYLSAEPA
jgi:hypothetical protein